MNLFTIDGQAFDVCVTSLERSFAVMDGDKAGRMLNARMHRDIKGTFYNYAITISTKNLNRVEYDRLYEIISAPVDSHIATLPYGQEMLSFEMYIANGKDNLIRALVGKNYWDNLSFNFVAMEPTRYPA